MALNREPELTFVHASAVVGDNNERATPVVNGDIDMAGAGIQGVLDHLFEHRCRTFNHLTGGDLVDQVGRQDTQGHDGFCVLCAR